MARLKSGGELISFSFGTARLYNGIVRLYNGTVRSYNGTVRLNNGTVRLYNGIVRLYNGTARLYNGILRKKSGSKLPGDGLMTATFAFSASWVLTVVGNKRFIFHPNGFQGPFVGVKF